MKPDLGQDAKDEAELTARLARARLRDLPKMSPGPRDFRRGDRWLLWHFDASDPPASDQSKPKGPR